MKRAMIFVAVVMVTCFTLAVSMRVKAKEELNKSYDRQIQRVIFDLEDSFEESEEVAKYVTDYEIDCTELGNGMYDIKVTMNMRGINIVEAHSIYDVVDDYSEYEYYLLNGKRVDEDYLTKIYPDF